MSLTDEEKARVLVDNMDADWSNAVDVIAIALGRERKEAEAENARLRTALKKWGRHNTNCGINARVPFSGPPPGCTCGYDAALTGAPDER